MHDAQPLRDRHLTTGEPESAVKCETAMMRSDLLGGVARQLRETRAELRCGVFACHDEQVVKCCDGSFGLATWEAADSVRERVAAPDGT